MSDPWLGQIILTGYNFAQRDFAKCEGQLMPISQNTALFSLLGVQFGGNGTTTFGLPDLRGRVPVGINPGTAPGVPANQIGQQGGQATVTLTVSEIPAHGHSPRLNAESRPGNSDDPTDTMIASHAQAFRAQAPSEDIAMNAAAVTEQVVGGSQPHDNMQPYLVLNYQIALQGVYPSRN